MTATVLSPQKVTLRAMEPEDLDMVYAMENDREVWDIGENNVPYSRYVLHDYIANSTADIYVDRQVRMVIDDECGDSIGLVDLVNFNPSHRRAEVGIVVRKDRRRCGYASAAMRLVTDYALHTLHVRQLYAVVPVANVASHALFTSLGFVSSSKLIDWLFDGKNYHDAVVMQLVL